MLIPLWRIVVRGKPGSTFPHNALESCRNPCDKRRNPERDAKALRQLSLSTALDLHEARHALDGQRSHEAATGP